MKIVAIILTFNEEKHIRRCLESLRSVATECLVVDCFSTDKTLEIAKSLGAKVLQNPWVNYATQFNWALPQVSTDADWVMRVDADEYITPEFVEEIRTKLPKLSEDITGIYCNRRMIFLGKLIRYGGVYPIRVLRLWRRDCGRCENRWMDEHIKLDGQAADFHGDIIDHNLSSLTWWTAKHNGYASREAVDLLNLKYSFMPLDTVANLNSGSQAGAKRWLKEKIYARLPGGLRAFLYFLYRYVFAQGFLDGKAGTTFHFLQGFWYRYLVDAKVDEVERYMREMDCSITEAINSVLGIKV